MSIQHETRYGAKHEWGVGCYTCDPQENTPPFWRRESAFEVGLEAEVVATRHDQLFDHKHDVVIYEFKIESRIC